MKQKSLPLRTSGFTAWLRNSEALKDNVPWQKSLRLRILGFTFVELLVVVTIIMVLATIGAVTYRQTNASARDSRRKADLESIRSALELCRAEAGEYPDDITGSIVCNTVTYLNPVPTDPKGGQVGYEYTYTKSGATEYTLCAEIMEGANETSPYCVTNP